MLNWGIPQDVLLLARPLQETAQGRGSGWIWAAVIIVLVLLIAWWGYRSSRQTASRGMDASQPVTRAAPMEMQAPPTPDDLVIIEGIGPKIASVLQGAGITTFTQLSQTDPARLEEILKAVNLRLADPHSWPEQARLAAAGDMAGLKTLQDQLKGGRGPE